MKTSDSNTDSVISRSFLLFFLLFPLQVMSQISITGLVTEASGYEKFQGLSAVSDQQNLFIFGTYNLGYLCAYEINETDNPILKWEFYVHQKPFFKIINSKLKWDEEKHVQGIKDIQINNDTIIVLYNGKSILLPQNKPEGAFSDILFLLDTKGNVLKKYKLDIPVLKIHYSERDIALYGITMTDDWQVVKYNLNL